METFEKNDYKHLFKSSQKSQEILAQNRLNFELDKKNIAELVSKFSWVRRKNRLELGSKNRKNTAKNTISVIQQ